MANRCLAHSGIASGSTTPSGIVIAATGESLERLFEPPRQPIEVAGVLEPPVAGEFGGDAEGHDLVGRQGPRPQAPLLSTPPHQRLDPRPDTF